MRVGIGLPNTIANTTGENLLQWARRADQLRFSCLGVLDRLVYDSYEPMTTLAVAAGATERIRLVSSIVIAPLRNTAILSKAALSLQKLSAGRFVMGLSLGARQDDYHAAGVPYGARGDRFDRQLADLLQNWRRQDDLQTMRVPLLIGGLSGRAFGRVARYADGYFHGGGPPRAFARYAGMARAAWEDCGRPGSPQLWGQGYFAIGGEAVAQAGRDYLRGYYAFTGPFAERIALELLTTPQQIAAFLRGYKEAGCDEIVLFPASNDIGQLERLAEVIPDGRY